MSEQFSISLAVAADMVSLSRASASKLRLPATGIWSMSRWTCSLRKSGKPSAPSGARRPQERLFPDKMEVRADVSMKETAVSIRRVENRGLNSPVAAPVARAKYSVFVIATFFVALGRISGCVPCSGFTAMVKSLDAPLREREWIEGAHCIDGARDDKRSQD